MLLIDDLCFKLTILAEIWIKMRYFFIEKLQKSHNTGGFALRTPCLPAPGQAKGFTPSIRRLRALPPDPQWLPAARGPTPDPSHNSSFIVNSWLCHWGKELKILESDREELEKTLRSIVPAKHFIKTTLKTAITINCKE